MTILLLGSGGREHALAWKMLQSSKCTSLFVAPGNAGTASIAKNVDVNPNDFEAVKTFVLQEKVEMVVVGPEDPLVLGIYDFFKNDAEINHIPDIGPSKVGAQLEGSKEFAKEFLVKHNIPTARYESFTKETVEKGCQFLETLEAPYVLKADGLGVVTAAVAGTDYVVPSALSGYLPLTAGSGQPLSGDLYVTKDNPKIFLTDNAGGSQNNYSINSNFGIFNLNDETAGGASVFSSSALSVLSLFMLSRLISERVMDLKCLPL